MFSKRQAPSARDSGFDLLQHEMAGEAAAALGRIGGKMEAALAALRAHDAGEDQTEPRDVLLKAAGHLDVLRPARVAWPARPAPGHRPPPDPREVLLRLGAS
uniref:Uncharacterized protein n=1 Tax=Phenylobacterium glaciei TaxID=2803784 RepID=A0A974P6S5_9CAUL|nr:hypothetical protein JKL49_13340 [Phenylobacterium glaciei]